jgi:hypothetical protein
MATRRCRSALAVLLGMLIVGCGGESDRATSTTDVATTVAPANLMQYLLQADDVPGLKPMASPQADSGPPLTAPGGRRRAARGQRLGLDDLPARPRRTHRRRQQRPAVRGRGRRATGWPTRRATRRPGTRCPALHPLHLLDEGNLRGPRPADVHERDAVDLQQVRQRDDMAEQLVASEVSGDDRRGNCQLVVASSIWNRS